MLVITRFQEVFDQLYQLNPGRTSAETKATFQERLQSCGRLSPEVVRIIGPVFLACWPSLFQKNMIKDDYFQHIVQHVCPKEDPEEEIDEDYEAKINDLRRQLQAAQKESTAKQKALEVRLALIVQMLESVVLQLQIFGWKNDLSGRARCQEAGNPRTSTSRTGSKQPAVC